MNIIKNKIKKYIKNLKQIPMRLRLKNKDFTIISNNCWGGFVSQDLGLRYNSPFVGLFVFAPDYIKFLKDIKRYLDAELKFTQNSKYSKELAKSGTLGSYPIGMLEDIEIHFLHYENNTEAKEKWERRLDRINFDNVFFKFCDRDLCTYEMLKEFDDLEFKNKVVFTAKSYPEIKASIQIKEYENKSYVDNEGTTYQKYFDVVEWLNQK